MESLPQHAEPVPSQHPTLQTYQQTIQELLELEYLLHSLPFDTPNKNKILKIIDKIHNQYLESRFIAERTSELITAIQTDNTTATKRPINQIRAQINRLIELEQTIAKRMEHKKP